MDYQHWLGEGEGGEKTLQSRYYVAWDPHFKCDINKLESIQRSAARFCTNDYNWTSSVTDMPNKLELDTLENRRRKARLNFMYKIINNQIDLKSIW